MEPDSEHQGKLLVKFFSHAIYFKNTFATISKRTRTIE